MNNFDLSLFNPASQSEANFVANFIARQKELQYFLAHLRKTPANQAAKHHLIIAPRGFGKTSLLRRLHIALRSDEFKHSLIPLGFREEQHNVISLDLFWRNCLQSLLETREDEAASPAELQTLDDLWQAHAPRGALKREQQDGQPAMQAFMAHCHSLGRRPVLLIDNLDALLAGLEKHQWGLRTCLQMSNGPILIAAASRYPEPLSDPGAAFFDFFRITQLEPLPDHEVMTCLRQLARLRGARGAGVAELLENDPGRVSALNTMAGGNPRTLGVLYSVLETHMSDDVLAQLQAMLDQFTGWYQARTEELPLQSRAVFDALALNWNPMTAATLATATGLDTQSVNSHLNRLEKSGYVESVALTHHKKGRSGYQVSERFYNIWYLMRNGSRRTRQTIGFLTRFLQACFSPRERFKMAMARLQDGEVRPESMVAIANSIEHTGLRKQLLDKASLMLGDEDEDFQQYIAELRNKPNGMATVVAAELIQKARQQMDIAQFAEAESLLRQAIDRDKKYARPWHTLGYLYHQHLARYDEAETAYRKAIALGAKYATPWNNLGSLLADHRKRYDEAESAYRKAIALDAKDAAPWSNLGTLLADHLKRYDEAETAYRKAIALDAKYAAPWYNLGILLADHLKRYDEAETAYRKTIALDEKFALPWYNLGNLLEVHRKRYDEAETAYRKAIALDAKYAAPWNNLGNLLEVHRKRYAEAETAYRKAIALDAKYVVPWYNLGRLLQDHLGNYAEALNALQRYNLLTSWPYALGECALICALHLQHPDEAIQYAAQLKKNAVHPHTHQLLQAIIAWSDGKANAALRGWDELREFITKHAMPAPEEVFYLWLQRLLAWAFTRGDGPFILEAMQEADYPRQYAPWFHACMALEHGPDHLLTINPEVRGMASTIYEEITALRPGFERDFAARGKRKR